MLAAIEVAIATAETRCQNKTPQWDLFRGLSPSKMERLAKIVNGWKPLTISAKPSNYIWQDYTTQYLKCNIKSTDGGILWDKTSSVT